MAKTRRQNLPKRMQQRQTEPSTLDNVPYDIIVEILKALDSFDSLSRLIRTSSLFYNAFIANADTITRRLAFRKFPPEAFRVLNLCRPPYEDANREDPPNTIDERDGSPTKVPPIPAVPFFACRFIKSTRSTWTVKSKIGRIDTNLSPDPRFIGYHEVRRLFKNEETIEKIVQEITDSLEEEEDVDMERVFRNQFRGSSRHDLPRAVYNIYLLGSLVYSDLPFAYHHHKLAEVVGIDCLPILDIPYRVVRLMVQVMETYSSGFETMAWDLPIQILGRCDWFPTLTFVALATQILSGDWLGLEGESKAYGKETSREALEERVEILRTILAETESTEGPHASHFHLTRLSWTIIQLDAYHNRKILINNYDDEEPVTPITLYSRDSLRHKYFDVSEAVTSHAENTKSSHQKRLQAQAWESIEGLNKVVEELFRPLSRRT